MRRWSGVFHADLPDFPGRLGNSPGGCKGAYLNRFLNECNVRSLFLLLHYFERNISIYLIPMEEVDFK